MRSWAVEVEARSSIGSGSARWGSGHGGWSTARRTLRWMRGRRWSCLVLPPRKQGECRDASAHQHRRQRDGFGQDHETFNYSVDDCPSRASNSENKSAFLSRYCKSLTALTEAPVRTTPLLVASVLWSRPT